MKKFKKIAAAAASLAVMTATTMSLSGSAVTTVRDPDGDGRILLSDGSFILQYLKGNFNPTSQRSLDFDGNGIISNKDATMLQHYWMQLMDGGNIIDESQLPAPVGADTLAVSTTTNYIRHYYNSNIVNQVYSLTVDPLNNTNTSPNANSQQRIIIGENDMELDSDTAIVNLSIGGTGFIVDDHIIATAAHCVYDKTGFFNFTIKLVDNHNNVKIVSPKYVDINKSFSDKLSLGYTSASYYDYALIYVEEDLSKYGSLNMGVALDQYINNNGEVTVSGFPDTYPAPYDGQEYGIRFKAKGNIVNTDLNLIRYDADTSGGDSGGPVYVEESFSTNNSNSATYKYKSVIAINVCHTNLNEGVRITPDMLKFFLDNPNIEY